MLLTLALSLALSGAPKVDAKLVGTWLAGTAPFVTFSDNGTGTMDEGKVKWTADGTTLTVIDGDGTADKMTYKLQGDALVLNIAGTPMTLTRAKAGVQVQKQGAFAAKAAKAKGQESEEDDEKEAMAAAQEWLAKNGQGQAQAQGQPMGRAGAPAGQPAPRAAGNDQLSRLLMSSAWCSFSYNKISGASSQTRAVFYANGTWSTGGRSETYNSGAAGSVAGQYDSNNGGQWAVQGGTLWMSIGAQPMGPVPGFSVSQNSSGYPIIHGDGKEYSSCN